MDGSGNGKYLRSCRLSADDPPTPPPPTSFSRSFCSGVPATNKTMRFGNAKRRKETEARCHRRPPRQLAIRGTDKAASSTRKQWPTNSSQRSDGWLRGRESASEGNVRTCTCVHAPLFAAGGPTVKGKVSLTLPGN